jgi:hypothetical protein
MLVCPSPVEVSGKLGTVKVKGLTENKGNNEDDGRVDRLFGALSIPCGSNTCKINNRELLDTTL